MAPNHTPHRARHPRAGLSILLIVVFALALAGVAHAASNDVDGDGKTDTIQLIPADDGTGRYILQVDLVKGRKQLTAYVGTGFTVPQLSRVKNVDDRRGAEIFIVGDHISTFDTIYIFTLRSSKLHRAGKLPAFGGDDGIKFGFNCGTSAGKHVIVAHRFLRGTNGKWKRRNLKYVWQSGDLVRSGKASYETLSGSPPRNQTGIGC